MIDAGIYIHLPFCNVKCMYCDFYSVTDANDRIPESTLSSSWHIKPYAILDIPPHPYFSGILTPKKPRFANWDTKWTGNSPFS